MNNVVIHAGPPKTGTTSIQTFLQKSSLRGVCYLGVFQPRQHNKSSNSLRDKVYAYINGVRNSPDEISEIRDLVESNLDNTEVAIFTEEMILHGLNWRSKIKRLYDIFGQYNPSVSICLRGPKETLLSYYQEIYSSLDKDLRSDFSSFVNSEYGDIYNYREVEQCFESSGFQDICFFHFDDLIGGRLFLRDLGVQGIPDADVRIRLSRNNKSKKDHRGYRLVEINRIDEMENLFSSAIGFLKRLGPPGRYTNRAIRSMMETSKTIEISHVDKCDSLQKVYESYQKRIS